MSRHRFVRGLDVEEVLASDSYVISDEEADDIRYEGIDTTQQAQMDSALEHIRATLVANFKTEADATTKGLISNTEIKDVLWDSYFNVDESLDWATKEARKRTAGKKKKDSEPSGAELADSVEIPGPPLSALRRLSLAHKASSNAATGKPKTSLSALAQKSRASAVGSGTSKPPLRSLLAKPSTSSSSSSPSLSSGAAQPTVPVQASKLSLLAKAKTPTPPASTLSSATPKFVPGKSKLAMKIQSTTATKSAQPKPNETLNHTVANSPPPNPIDPLFAIEPSALVGSSTSQTAAITPLANPSNFAAILVATAPHLRSDGSDIKTRAASVVLQRSFQFDTPSPDDVIFEKRANTRLASNR